LPSPQFPEALRSQWRHERETTKSGHNNYPTFDPAFIVCY
jgi:hypothetical protein